MSTFFFSPLRAVAGTAVGVGVGQSVADAISPITRELANEAWARYLSMPVGVVEAAAVVASGERSLEWGLSEARQNGVNDERFAALVDMWDTSPDLTTLFELLHRGLISEAEFREGAGKQLIEAKWLDGLLELRERVLSPAEAAAAWQQGYMDEGSAQAEAALSGVNGERSSVQRQLAGMPPGPETALDMLRRGIITEADFAVMIREGNTKTKYTDEYLAIRDRLLSPAEAANAWQQGYMDEGEAEAEALASGISADRSSVQRQLAGMPPGPQTALDMLRRGIITEADFAVMIREGHTKTKYTDEYLATRDHVTSATTAAGLWLRGWLTEQEAKRIGALTGYGDTEMEHLYLNRGRPATTRQVHIGWARGGRLEGAADERAAFERAVRQSNVRTEYTDLLWAQRYTYPSAFVLRALAADGTFDRDTTERILLESGWVPEYAKLAADKWAGAGTAGVGTKWADRARSRLFTAAHNDYMDGNASADDGRAMLQAIGVTAAEQTTVLNLWAIERDRTRRDLTQAQVLKLVKVGTWTPDRALAALLDLGMDEGDARDLLTTV